MKKIIYILFFYLLSAQTYAADAGDAFGINKITDNLKIGGDDLVVTADNILGFIIGLFYFVAIILAIYGGFTILVSGGDEEKVKKGKNTIIYMAIGLIVIFLSSQFIRWIIKIMSDENIVGS